MTRTASLGAFLVATAWAVTASAQVVPMVDRPIVLPEGVGQLSLDLSLTLNQANPAHVGGLTSGLPSDRAPGLSVAYGLARGIDGGLSVPYVYARVNQDNIDWSYDLAKQGWPLRRDPQTRNHFGPIQVWAAFRLADWIAAELAVLVPIEDIRANRIAARASLPIRYRIIPGRLAVRFRPDLILGFGRGDENQGADIQASFFVDAGLIVSITREFYLDVGLGYGLMINPRPHQVLRDWPGISEDDKNDDQGYLPVAVTLGYTVTPTIDLFLGFALTNLTPGSASKRGPADDRSLTVGLNYRF